MARRSLDSEPSMSEVHLVQISLEDLILAVVLFHLAGGRLLPKLAGKAEVSSVDDVGMHVPDELLRDRTRATAPLAEQLALDCRRDADEVDAVVLVEPLILDGDEGLWQITGERSQAHRRPELAPNLPDERGIPAEDER